MILASVAKLTRGIHTFTDRNEDRARKIVSNHERAENPQG